MPIRWGSALGCPPAPGRQGPLEAGSGDMLAATLEQVRSGGKEKPEGDTESFLLMTAFRWSRICPDCSALLMGGIRAERLGVRTLL